MPKNLPLQIISLLLSAGLLTIIWNFFEKYISFKYHREKNKNEIILDNIFIPFYPSIEKSLFKFPTLTYEISELHQMMKHFLTYLENNPSIKFYLNPNLVFTAHESFNSLENYMILNNYLSYSIAKSDYVKFSKEYLKELNKIRKSAGLAKYGYQYRKYNHLYSCPPSFFPIQYWVKQIINIFIKILSSYFIILIGLLILSLLFIKIYTFLINIGLVH